MSLDLTKIDKLLPKLPECSSDTFHDFLERFKAIMEACGLWKYFDGSHDLALAEEVQNNEGEIVTVPDRQSDKQKKRHEKKILESKAVLKLLVKPQMLKELNQSSAPSEMMTRIKEEYEQEHC